MNLQKLFEKALRQRYPETSPKRLAHTRHWNVRQVDQSVAKAIAFIDTPNDLIRALRAWKTEIDVYQTLHDQKSLWPIQLEDAFIIYDYERNVPLLFVIVTSMYLPRQRKRTWALQLREQLDYLHRHGFLHNDLELKNILVDTLIDFEKSKRVPSGIQGHRAKQTEKERLEELIALMGGDLYDL